MGSVTVNNLFRPSILLATHVPLINIMLSQLHSSIASAMTTMATTKAPQCQRWCYANKKPWTVKCAWLTNDCSACPECDRKSSWCARGQKTVVMCKPYTDLSLGGVSERTQNLATILIGPRVNNYMDGFSIVVVGGRHCCLRWVVCGERCTNEMRR